MVVNVGRRRDWGKVRVGMKERKRERVQKRENIFLKRNE